MPERDISAWRSGAGLALATIKNRPAFLSAFTRWVTERRPPLITHGGPIGANAGIA